MRVLFLSAASSIHTVRWVNALAKRKHEVVLVSLKNHQNKEKNILPTVEVVYLPITGNKGYYLNAFFLHHIYKKGEFDVVNVHYASGYGTLARVARLPHIILNVWGSDVYDFPYESKLKGAILRKNLSYAAQIASTSHAMARQAKKLVNTKRDMAITLFGVDLQKFRPAKEKEDCKKFIFGTAKTLSSKYGIDTIIEAFGRFLQEVPETEKKAIRLEIYGKGNQVSELKRLVKKKNLQQQVCFGGYIENSKLPKILGKMDVFLLGSRRESFGVAAVEAMACGLPVVATKVDGFEEVMEDGKTGFLVPVDDAEAMAGRMLQLYQDKDLRKVFGLAGRKRVEHLYDWDKNVDEMVQVYRKNRICD